jgi:hypothetical protein
VNLLINLIALTVICGIVWYILNMIPVPEPFRWVVNVVAMVIFLVLLLSLLSGNFTFYPLGGKMLR